MLGIAAQPKVDSAKLMCEASDILNTPAAIQIRYLESLVSMSKQAGSKVILCLLRICLLLKQGLVVLLSLQPN